jgi:tetratricopeptide (TPR) repeat protein
MKAASKSRLLMRLEAALAKTRNPVDAACLRVERAGFLARHGHFDKARSELAAVHAAFDHHPQAPVSVWLCIAEAWVLHFSSLSGSARDKMMRAQALSAATGLTQLQALSSAWLAQMAYSNDDIEAMVRDVTLSLKLAAPDNHGARARACLVVALAYHFAERLDRAQPWYARAREHAATEGDDTTLSALNHNLTGHRVQHAMQAAVFGGDTQDEARHALAGTESTRNFDEWIGTVSLDAFVPMQRAAIASVQGQYGQALALYEKHMADAQKQGLGRWTSNYLADMAWCRWHLGDSAGARRDASAAAAGIDDAMHLDDRAVAHGRLGSLFKLLGDEDAALKHAAEGRECWAAHHKFQCHVLDLLEKAQLRP